MNAQRYARLFFQTIGGLALGMLAVAFLGPWTFLLLPLAFWLVVGLRDATENLTQAEVQRRSLAWALSCIDVGLCLIIFVLVPKLPHYPLLKWHTYLVAHYQWETLLPLFLAVFLISAGIYKIVDAFYIRPSSEVRSAAGFVSSNR